METKRLDLSSEQQKLVNAGGRVNSFYDVYDDGRIEEEIQEYKRFLGMPLSEDYEELIASLK